MYRNYRHNNKYNNNNNNKSWSIVCLYLTKIYLQIPTKSSKIVSFLFHPKYPSNYTPTYFTSCALVYGARSHIEVPTTTISDCQRSEETLDRIMRWKPDEFSLRYDESRTISNWQRISEGGNARWTAGAIYLFYLGWLWTGIGDLDGLVGRQPPGVPLDVDAGVHSGLLLRLPCPSSFLTASSLHKHLPKVPRVTPGPLLGPRSYTSNPQFLTWNKVNEIGSIWAPKHYKLFVESR